MNAADRNAAVRRSATRTRTLASQQTVLVVYFDRAAFLDNYWINHGHRGLFVPGHLSLQTGQPVTLEVAFAKPAMVFRARGVVRSRSCVRVGTSPTRRLCFCGKA